jgi:hypothetical protein
MTEELKFKKRGQFTCVELWLGPHDFDILKEMAEKEGESVSGALLKLVRCVGFVNAGMKHAFPDSENE